MPLSKLNLYKSEWLDLVFEKRNKNYGAYELRQHYADNMSKAIAITVFAFVGTAITLSIITAHQNESKETEQRVEVTLKQVNPVKPKKEPIYQAQPPKHQAPPQKQPLAAAPPVKSISFPVMQPADKGTAEPPKIDLLEKNVISSTTTSGTQGNVNAPVNTTSTQGGEPGGTRTESDNSPVLAPEVFPEPLGGANAWGKFLQKNLHYPPVARENGVQGKVIVSFVVEKDGHLSDIKVLRGIGSGCDEEAVRVLKLAPAWKPGRQNGQPVRVQYTIPINFQLAEE